MLIFEPGRELLKVPIPENVFLVEPYLPRGSVVMIFGKPGLGKTALAWQMAQAVQTGQPIWNLPVRQANVLFLELDMPVELAQIRWTDAEPVFEPEFVTIFDSVSIDCMQFMAQYPDERHRIITDNLRQLHSKYEFGLVCVDALREVVVGDLNPGGAPRRVYDAFHTIFPGAALLFVHHEKKANQSFGPYDALDMAAGNKEFINVAQVALHFHRVRTQTFLTHAKTQASVQFAPLPLLLHEDGVHFTNQNDERDQKVVEIMQKAPKDIGMRDLDKLIGKELGISDRTARTIRKGLAQKAGT